MIIDSRKYSGPCACGRTHQMETKLVVVEEGVLERFDSYLEEYGLTGKQIAERILG